MNINTINTQLKELFSPLMMEPDEQVARIKDFINKASRGMIFGCSMISPISWCTAHLIEPLIKVTNTTLSDPRYDLNAIENAICPIQETVRQFNLKLPERYHLTSLDYKLASTLAPTMCAPFVEESIYRYLIQDVLLMQIPTYLIKKIAPNYTSALDSTIAKTCRIVLASALFAVIHETNWQIIATFVAGIGFGILKESKLGLPGAIGAHMINNLLIAIPEFFKC